MAEGYEVGVGYVRIKPDTDGFAEELEAKVKEATEGAEGKVKLGADDAELQAALDDAKAKLDALDGREVRVRLRADDAELRTKVDDATADLAALDGMTATARLGMDKADFDAKRDEAVDDLAALDGMTATARADLNKTDFDTQMDEAEARLDAFKTKSASARLGGTGGGGGGDSGFSMPGGLLTYGLIAGASLAPGIGGAATGLGLLGGTGFLAFDGITKALSAAHQASLNVGLTSQQLAAQEYSNSVQIAQAQTSIAMAHQQAAQDAITSAASIEQAQMNLASVERNTAASQIQAMQQVTQSKQGVEQADYGLREAQYTLSQAWVQARENIINLNNALADNKLNVEQAKLAVREAEYQQRLTNQNAYSTDIQRQQAALAVAQAKQQVIDAQAREAESQYAANLANKQGVDGSQTMIQAKQGVTAAQYSLIDAVKAEEAAQRNLTLTELNNAAQVRQAKLQLRMAEEQAAFQQRMDAQSVAIAQRNLTFTIRQQRLEWASMLSTQNQAANQFVKDMARLSPAGRAFVDQVLSMRGAFRQLRDAAQSTVLPGMTVWLNGIKSLLPTVGRGVSEMGRAMGQAFAAFGRQMQTPGFVKVLNGLIANGIKFANIVLPAAAQFIQELAIVGSKKGAVDGLANGLAGLIGIFTNLVKGLAPFTGALSQFWSVIGQALADLGGPIGQVIGALAASLAPALQALLPGWKALLDALGGGLAKALVGLAPLLRVAGVGITELVVAIAPILPQIGTLIGQLATSLAPLLASMLPSINSLARGGFEILTIALQALGPAIVQVLPPLVKLLVNMMPLISVITKIGAVLLTWIADLTGPVLGGLGYFTGLVVGFAASLAGGFRLIASVAMWLWHDVLDPMWHGFLSGAQWLAAEMPGVIAKIVGAFKTPVNFLINTVYDGGIRKFWNDIVGAIGLKSLDLPFVSPLAHGGVIPGYSPGHDTRLAAVSPGEGILTPQATQAIGGKPAIDQLNKQYPPSSSKPAAGDMLGRMAGHDLARRLTQRPAEHLLTGGKFATGGVVGTVGGWFSGIGHGIGSFLGGLVDAGKIAVALATGNTTALANALGKFIGTDAAGSLGRVMTAIPRTLAGDLVRVITGYGGGGGTGSLHVPGNVTSWIRQGMKLAGVSGADWESGLTIIAMNESAGNQAAVNRWDSNWKAGHPSAGLLQFIQPTFLKYAMPGHTQWMNPVDQVIADAWDRGYIRSVYGSIDSVPGVHNVRKGLPYIGYDRGGPLPPGPVLSLNRTGRTEEVLTPAERAAWVALVKRMLAQPGAGAGGPHVTMQFIGTQLPNPEQMAEIERRLGLALGGV